MKWNVIKGGDMQQTERVENEIIGLQVEFEGISIVSVMPETRMPRKNTPGNETEESVVELSNIWWEVAP